MAASVDRKSQFFFALTPDRVLESVERAGLRCTGRCLTLNSFENRVYEVELEAEVESEPGEMGRSPLANVPSATVQLARRRVVKFYRPGRWSETQIRREHEFLAQLQAAEIPVIAPIAFADGQTLQRMVMDPATPEEGIYFALFPKVGGRAPDELIPNQLRRIGRLLGRIHAVGAMQPAPERIRLDPLTYGLGNLRFLLEGDWIPLEFKSRYQKVVEAICARVAPDFAATPIQRLHGDCHLGNLLWNDAGPFFLDFDDMVMGPAVQDLWLLMPGRPEGDAEARQRFHFLLDGYEEMREFDRTTLRLIEPLRALRFVHYTAWVARRWEDPAFPQAFPNFGTHSYWSEETDDLEEQLRLIVERIPSDFAES